MRSVFINLPTPFLEDSKRVYPLGILYVATYVQAVLGHEVEILDLAAASDAEFETAVRGIHADVVGVSAVTPQARHLSLVPTLCPEPFLVAGGIHPSIFPQQALGYGYDAVIVGEAEYLLGDVFGYGNESANHRRGILHGEHFPLSEIPWPNRKLFSGYSGPAPMMAGRGCPFSCAFCAQTDHQVRYRRVSDVIAELATLPDKDVVFYDDTFTSNVEWLREFSCGARGLRKNLRCSTRADKLTVSVASLLNLGGFTEVCIGVESGCQRILDGIKKHTRVEQNTEAIKTCREYGLRSKAFIMLGLPGETEESLAETYNWIEQTRPDSIGLYIFNPLPGSDIYDHPEKYDIGIERQTWDQAFYGGDRRNMRARVFTSGLSAEKITEAYYRFLGDFKGLLA